QHHRTHCPHELPATIVRRSFSYGPAPPGDDRQRRNRWLHTVLAVAPDADPNLDRTRSRENGECLPTVCSTPPISPASTRSAQRWSAHRRAIRCFPQVRSACDCVREYTADGAGPELRKAPRTPT